MAVLATTNPTLADWAKLVEPGTSSITAVAEVLNQTNRILDDATFLPANQPTSHVVSIRTGLPDVYWRSFNEGITPSKSTAMQVTEGMGMLESRSEVDTELAKLNGDIAAFRASEDRAFIEAMGQELSEKMFYGNPATSPKEFLGLAARYSSLSAGNAQNVLDGGAGAASGATNTSVWLCVWSPETLFCTYPKGSMAGLEHRDLGEMTAQDVNGVSGTRMQVFSSLFRFKHGLVSKDWRYVVRIANLRVAQFATLGSEQAPTVYTNIVHKMLLALDRIPDLNMGRAVFYANRSVTSLLRRLSMEKSAAFLGYEKAANVFGQDRMNLTFMGVPVHTCDAILNTESPVT